jgi:hypothetical protein
MRAWRLVVALTSAAALAMAAGPAQAVQTVKVSGAFSFTSANGILPTWTADDIVLIGVSPGSVVTSTSNLTARVSMPIVAKTGSANAAAGGFRINNVSTGDSVRCSSPTIDTRARVVDCVMIDGTNLALFAITSIGSQTKVTGSATVTYVYRKLTLRLNGQRVADMLNRELATTTFSPYVTVGTGDLVVITDR